MAEQKAIKQINIQKGVVGRTAKDRVSYMKELVIEEARLAKIKDGGGDSHEIKKQEEVIQETQVMITDTKKRMRVANEKLSNLLEENKEMLAGTAEYKAASQQLKDGNAELEQA